MRWPAFLLVSISDRRTIKTLSHAATSKKKVLLALLVLLHLVLLVVLLAGPHYILEKRKLRGFWGGCDGKFHLFHQVLGWSSCLRSPTNRHALVRPGRIVSPDLRCHFVVSSYSYDCITTSIALSTRTNALWYLETPMTLLQRTGTAPLIDCIRRFSVSDPTRPRR